MAGQGHGARRRSVLRATAAALVPLGGAAACAGPAPPGALSADRAQRLLDRRARALLTRDAAGYRATTDPGPDGGAPPADPVYDRLAAVPLRSWTYRVTSVRAEGDGDRATVRADRGHRIADLDPAPVVSARVLDLRRRAGRWYVAADRPAEGAPRQLWEQGPVEVVRGERSLVLGSAGDRARLTELAGLADRAVPAVAAAWDGDRSRRLLVLVPGTLTAMGRLLGAPADGYRGIAAVTTGRVGGEGPADRIVVNPETYPALGAFGRQAVLTHEATHVATRAHTSAATPLWLSEGYADWVAYRAEPDGDAPRLAPELARAVRDGRVPGRLPGDDDFGFGQDPARLARAYEGGWLACETAGERWGAARLNALYRAVGARERREGAADAALREVCGVSEEEFTGLWRTYLRRVLG
ncbi:hypothetical protein JNUCC64_26190 [Streptomyces sp. JNUCC 64]